MATALPTDLASAPASAPRPCTQAPDVVLFAGSLEAVNAFRAEHCGDDPAAPGTLIRSEADLDTFVAGGPCASST
jgi:hypothetical protein